MIYISDCRNGYQYLVGEVLTHGKTVAPRGIPTREIQAETICLTNPERCLVVGVNRKANLAIGAAEALQLVGGVSMPDLMVKIAPNFAKFLDGGAFYGAYGPRIRAQLPHIRDLMVKDPYTRRAFVTIWRSDDLFTEGSVDYPCTIGFTFQMRDGKLDMHTHMRSNDVWWGFTYDVMQFCFLQLTMAHQIGVPTGQYFHHVDSLHIYERDLEAAGALAFDHSYDGRVEIGGLKAPSFVAIRRIAEQALKCDMPSTTTVTNPTAKWFSDLIQERLTRAAQLG